MEIIFPGRWISTLNPFKMDKKFLRDPKLLLQERSGDKNNFEMVLSIMGSTCSSKGHFEIVTIKFM